MFQKIILCYNYWNIPEWVEKNFDSSSTSFTENLIWRKILNKRTRNCSLELGTNSAYARLGNCWMFQNLYFGILQTQEWSKKVFQSINFVVFYVNHQNNHCATHYLSQRRWFAEDQLNSKSQRGNGNLQNKMFVLTPKYVTYSTPKKWLE